MDLNAMRLHVDQQMIGKIIGFGLGFGVALNALPVQAQTPAQISDQQVDALVEALRQAAPQTGQANDGLYSDWQVQAGNIPRWSEFCLDRSLSPDEFDANAAIARQVITCIVRDVLVDEYGESNGDTTVAVLRSAAWWMTGDASRYNSEPTQNYTQQVLRFYQQQLADPSSSSNNSGAAANPAAATAAPPSATSNTPSVYDRYMQAGYAATNQRDYGTALLYFQRALDERPNDVYAQEAIENVERYQSQQNQEEPEQEEPNPDESNQDDRAPADASSSDTINILPPTSSPSTSLSKPQ